MMARLEVLAGGKGRQMGRHRKHVLYNKSKDEWYCNVRLPDGKYRQKYLCKGKGNGPQAWARYNAFQEAQNQPVTPPGDLRFSVRAPKIDLYRETFPRHDEIDLDDLWSMKREAITSANIENYLETLETEQAKLVRQHFEQFQQWQTSFGIESQSGKITDKSLAQIVGNRTKSIDAERAGRIALGMVDNVPTTVRLRDLFDCFISMKEASQKPPTKNAIKQIKTRFYRLMAVIGGCDKSRTGITKQDIEKGNIQLHELTPQHLADFRYWITNQGLAASTCNDHLGIFGQITNFCRVNKPDLRVPAHFDTWNRQYLLKETVAESDDNKEPMPVDVFCKMLKAAANPTPVATATTFGARNAQRQKKYEAIRNGALLRFMLNFAADPIDCERLKWNHLALDDELPACTLPRIKVAKKVGKPIKRNTPMLPSTVDALRQLRQHDGHSDFVFLDTEQNQPLTSSGVSQAITRLAKAAKGKRLREDGTYGQWTAKYLRNVGSSLGVTWGHNLNAILIDRFLGHAIKTEAKKYIGKHSAESLIPIVNLIGEHYCNGERIGQ